MNNKNKMERDPASEQKQFSVSLASGLNLQFDIHDSLASCESQWRCFEHKAKHTPFQKFGWISSWQHTLGQGLGTRPLIVLGYIDNALVIIMPLGISRQWGTSFLHWLADDFSDYPGALIVPDLLEKLTMTDIKQLWKTIGRQPAMQGVSFLRAKKQLKYIDGIANPFSQYNAYKGSDSAHDMLINEAWELFFQTKKNARTRQRMRSKERKLAKNGDLKFQVVTKMADRQKMILQVLDWKKQQLEEWGMKNPFEDKHSLAFFNHIAQNPDCEDFLQLFGLWVGDELVSCAIGLEDAGTFILYQTVYKPKAYTRLSPGRILLIKMMEHAARKQPVIFDFALGDEGYKFEWSDHQSDLLRSFFAFSLSGYGYILADLSRLKTKIWLKEMQMSLSRLKNKPRVFGVFRHNTKSHKA